MTTKLWACKIRRLNEEGRRSCAGCGLEPGRGATEVLATTTVGAIDPDVRLGRPIFFDDLFFSGNHLPNGGACTLFTEPGDPERGHLIQSEPFSPHLRRRAELAARSLGLEVTVGGVYAHTNGPRFETRAEVRWLRAAGVAAVSQTSGPEAVLAGELGLPYGLVGFPVNHAAGVSEPEPKEALERLLGLSAEVLYRLVLRTAATLKGADLTYDHGYVHRVEGGVADNKAAPPSDVTVRGSP